MLDTIRTHKRFMLFFLVLLIFPAFVFMGVQGYDQARAPGTVAKLGGMSISMQQLEEAHKQKVQEELDQGAQGMGATSSQGAVLGNMIAQQLTYLAVTDSRLIVSDAAVREALMQNPVISELKKPDGSFDEARYIELLKANNLQPAQFEESIRSQVMMNRLMSAVSTGIASSTDVDQMLEVWGEKFIIRQQLFMPEQFIEQVQLTPEQLKAYYEQNASSFLAPEYVSIEYVILDAQEFAKKFSVPADDVRAYYETNTKQLYSSPEQRRASHILIDVDSSATQVQKDEALAKAQQLLAQVRQDPSQFAEIAKANSTDTGSAAKGGDVGLFKKGDMLEAFDNAVYAMTQEGDISDLVVSPWGYHIILLTGIKPADYTPFEDVQSQIETQLRMEMANQAFAKVAEDFKEDVYVNRDDLKFVAQKYALTVQTAENVTMHPQAGATGVLASPSFITAVFAPQARDSHQNIQALQISPTQLASARVITYTPPKALPYEEVAPQVSTLATQAKALELAQAAGREALAQWQQSAGANQNGEALTVTRQQPTDLAPELTAQVFALSSQAPMPHTVGVELRSGGYAVAQVERVEPADPVEEGMRGYIKALLMQQAVAAQQRAYMNYLENKYDVKVFPDVMQAAQNNQVN